MTKVPHAEVSERKIKARVAEINAQLGALAGEALALMEELYRRKRIRVLARRRAKKKLPFK